MLFRVFANRNWTTDCINIFSCVLDMSDGILTVLDMSGGILILEATERVEISCVLAINILYSHLSSLIKYLTFFIVLIATS